MEKHLDSEAVFSTMSPRQAVRYMAVPAIISQLIVLVYNLADTFFLGRMNDPQMIAGVSLILPVFNISKCAECIPPEQGLVDTDIDTMI